MDIAEVRRVAHLARLDLSDADLAIMAGQLSAILAYVDQLQKLNTDGVEPLAHPLPLQNVFRADEAGESLSVDAALGISPKRIGDFFGVPAIFDTGESRVE